ncbi:hypothetical protein AZE42_07800 [Rhizopogon vesiculosus]|uniref:Magnesium transporter n=1 Tax=Rhizopogon vesiculosus TaxID=180088 RepID=A0A1J8QZU1_9AGAM|nr:hypothetical protein AZE42_07800 [Rhizopogon vesiculosus]
MDVDDDGKFTTDMKGDGSTSSITPDIGEKSHTSPVPITNDEFWDMLQRERRGNIRVRSLSVEHLTSPVLCMLGTTYNIEPFFFTSSINWIPSRYQEALSHGKGDHITITLPFVRTIQRELNSRSSTAPTPRSPATPRSLQSLSTDNEINTEKPLKMLNGDVLFIDLLAIHMVRSTDKSTIISYHPESRLVSSAKRLHLLMELVGDSVYWQNIFSKSKDPTFLFLAILWVEVILFKYTQESDVLKESRVEHTHDLHTLQAHLLHYQSLLHAFQLSVSFIDKTPNPAMESENFFDEQRDVSNELMKKECENLLNEIDRLQKRREMLSKRLKNVMNLAFANVNIRDSASMRQVAYMTMIFLPASLIASIFGMNVKEINPGTLGTIVLYAEVTIALTAFIFYVVVTLQTHTSFHKHGASLWKRAVWPIILPGRLWGKLKVIRRPVTPP